MLEKEKKAVYRRVLLVALTQLVAVAVRKSLLSARVIAVLFKQVCNLNLKTMTNVRCIFENETIKRF